MKCSGATECAPGGWSLGLRTVLPPPYLCSVSQLPVPLLLGTSGPATLPIPAPDPAVTVAFHPCRGLGVSLGRVDARYTNSVVSQEGTK